MGEPSRKKLDSCVNRRSLKLSMERHGAYDNQDDPDSACGGCVRGKAPCVIASKVLKLPVVLPLPERHRGQFGPQDPGF